MSQEFCRPLDGGKRALQFVGQGLDIPLHVLLPFQGLAHPLEGPAHVADLAAVQGRQSGLPTFTNRVRVSGELLDGPDDPENEHRAQDCHHGARQHAFPGHPFLGDFQEMVDVGGGFAHGEDPGHLPLHHDRRRHVEDGGGGVPHIHIAGAGAVFAPQGQDHVAPIGIVITRARNPLGIEEDDPLIIGDVNPHVHAGLVELVDAGEEPVGVSGVEYPPQVLFGKPAGRHVLAHLDGQDPRLVDEDVLHPFQVPEPDVRHEPLGQVGKGAHENYQEPHQDADAEFHRPSLRE